jgi:hypothetical protein
MRSSVLSRHSQVRCGMDFRRSPPLLGGHDHASFPANLGRHLAASPAVQGRVLAKGNGRVRFGVLLQT